MRRPAKIVLLSGLGLLGLLLLACVSALWLVQTGWFREKIRERIVGEVEKATGGRAELGEFAFDWRKLTARIQQFVLHGKEGAEEPPLLQIRSVEVGLKIVSAFRRDVDIELLALQSPRIYIVVYEDSSTNIPKPRNPRAGNTLEQILALAVGRFRIEGGLVEFGDRKIPVDVRGENLQARFAYEPKGPRYTGQLGFRSLRLESARMPLDLDADASIAITEDRIEVSALRIASGRSNAKLSGVVRDIRSPRAQFDFEAAVSVADLGKLFPIPTVQSGHLSFKGAAAVAGASAYSADAAVSGSGLSLEQGEVRITGVRFKSDLNVTPSLVELRHLRISALGGAFAGAARLKDFRRFRLAGEVRDVSVSQLSSLSMFKTSGWSGRLSGPVFLEGELASQRPQRVQGKSRLDVVAETGGLPVEGSVEFQFDQATGAVEFAASRLAAGASRVEFSGGLPRGIRVSLASKNLADFLPVMETVRGNGPEPLPLTLRNGEARFDGAVTGSLSDLRVTGHGSIIGFEFQGRKFDRLAADITVAPDTLQASNLVLRANGATLRGDGRAGLRNWRLTDSSDIAGTVSLRGLELDKLLAEAGGRLPLGGELTGDLKLSGAYGSPSVAGKLEVRNAQVRDWRLDRVRADVTIAGGSVELLSAVLEAGESRLQAQGAFKPEKDNWKRGAGRFEVSSDQLSLARLGPLLELPEGLRGEAALRASGEASVADSKFTLSRLTGTLSLRDLTLDRKPLGDLRVTAATQSGSLQVQAAGKLAGADVEGRSEWRLEGDLPAQGELRFSRISLSTIRAWLQPAEDSPLEAFAEGRVAFSGAGLRPENWKARAEIAAFELTTREGDGGLRGLVLRNAGPVILAMEKKSIRLESAKLTGENAHLEASGTISLENNGPLQMRVLGDIDLKILENFEPNLTTSGKSKVDTTIRGRLVKPEIYGKLEFKGASCYLKNVPNGLDNVSGIVHFFRDRATVENVTATTGGGRLTTNGFIGYVSKEITYRLQANADQVRVRYPEGVSTTANASLSLTGSSTRSLLAGTVTILRSGITPRLDLAGLIGKSSQPVPAPAAQNELLRGMQFDIRVNTSADAKFETTLTRDIQAEADLRLRGTPYKPLLLGRASITQGEVIFFGNRYNISRGDILFLNPVKLEPVLNFDLETRVRGIDVAITFSGPPNKPNVSYRSDPPLQPSEIIALLAVGRAPTSDPTLLARQEQLGQQLGQDWGQLGASTVVGQALAAPVTGRLQRFFGVSRIKIDPRLTGIENNPQPQLMLEQQVSKDITFTYITDLSKGEQQVVRVEWNVNKAWSLQAVRQENGLFGIDILYRKQFK